MRIRSLCACGQLCRVDILYFIIQVPRFDCMFAKAAELASTPMLMYSNSDLIYFDDLLLAIGVVTAKVKKTRHAR